MARYSGEQRRRAVELYERYEHSAADVIRELGYPGKGALLMWYREWLEERRTGGSLEAWRALCEVHGRAEARCGGSLPDAWQAVEQDDAPDGVSQP